MKLSIDQIIAAVHGKLLNPAVIQSEFYIENITTDSRKQLDKGLFIPLRGERFDGHDFIKNVYDKGIIATLTMNNEVVDEKIATILVEDTNKALLDLGCFYRKQFTLPVVGITGSVGKTSTKEMISAVLSGKWHVHKTEGNFNNEIGLPLTLFNLNPSHEAAVIEMGMNHFGEIHNLTCSALPDVAVITNVGTSHIENLGSREGILKAKLEILDGLNPEGLLVINGDNDLLSTVGQLSVKMLSYGMMPTNDYWAKDIESEGEYTTATVISPRQTYTIRIRALGEHMVYNTLAAIAVAEYFNLTEEEIARGLASYTPAKMRMHITTFESGLTIIDDTYNASLDSMKAALKVLRDYGVTGRKVAILGDMFEMGEFAPKLHQEVGQFAAEMAVDVLIAIGDLAKDIYNGYQEKGTKEVYYFETKEAFIENIMHVIQKEDCVLLKASRGMHFEALIEEVRKVK